MRLPTDPNGYSVSADGTIHTRYSDHSTGQRTRTAKGVRNILEGRKGSLCKDCYQASAMAPPTDDTPRPPQLRRTAASASRKNGDASTLP